MKKTRAAVAALSAAAIPAAFLVAGVGSTSRAAVNATCAISPRSYTLGANAKTVTFQAPASAGTDWGIAIPDLGLSATDTARQDVIDPQNYVNADASAHEVNVVAFGSGSDCLAAFTLRRASNLKLQVAASGGTRYFAGRLLRYDLGSDNHYSAVKNATINIERYSGGTWSKVGTLVTDNKGQYGGKLRAGLGTWRATYAGTSTTGDRYTPGYTA